MTVEIYNGMIQKKSLEYRDDQIKDYSAAQQQNQTQNRAQNQQPQAGDMTG
jgi:hypothetical protein